MASGQENTQTSAEDAILQAISTVNLPHLRDLLSTLPSNDEVPLPASFILACLEPRSILCFEVLLGHDQSILNHEFCTGNTPLTSACCGSDPKMALWLLERGADPNRGVFLNGCSNLWVAVGEQPVRLVKRLVKCGAEVKEDSAALEHARIRGRMDVVKVLTNARKSAWSFTRLRVWMREKIEQL